MIESIRIKNYRSHKDTFIEFNKSVNAITGTNDSGKTNILRAITQVIKNRPSGDDFISHWGGNMSINISFGPKSIVRYKDVIKDKKTKGFKSGSKNYYILINNDKNKKSKIDKDYKEAIKTGIDFGCVEIFKAFGQGVPDKVSKIINMGDINLAPQFSGPFLLAKSAPDVAKFYNGIVNLDIIDSTISNINKMLKSEEKSLKLEKLDNKEKQEKLKDFEWIDKTEKIIKSCEKAQREIKTIKNNWGELFQLNKRLATLNEENEKINDIVKYEEKTNNLIELIKVIKKDNSDFVELENLYDEYNFYAEQKEKADRIVGFEVSANQLILLNESINELKENHESLTDLCGQLELLTIKNKKANKVIKNESKVNELILLNDSIQEKNKDYSLLESLANELDEISSHGSKCRGIIKHTDNVDTLLSISNKIDLNTAKYNELFDLSEVLVKYDMDIKEQQIKQEDFEKELKDNFPDECPLCSTLIKK